jgi:hypothetical protein
MPPYTIAKHLRERAATARILEAEADTPLAQRTMRDLAAHYETWADRIEKLDDVDPKVRATKRRRP